MLARLHRLRREHLFVMLRTLGLTVFVDLITAVAIGLIAGGDGACASAGTTGTGQRDIRTAARRNVLRREEMPAGTTGSAPVSGWWRWEER